MLNPTAYRTKAKASLVRGHLFFRTWLMVLPFALLPSLAALVSVGASVPPDLFVLARSWVLLAAVALLLHFAVTRICGSAQAAAAALALGISVFTLYIPVRQPILKLTGGAGAYALGLCYLLGCAGLTLFISRAQRSVVAGLYDFVRSAAVVLAAVIPFVVLFYYAIPLRPPNDSLRGSAQLAVTAHDERSAWPDVYHLIFDGFGRPDVLQTMYGLDLSRFVSTLKERGFDVAEHNGVANYNQTYLSVASVLNASYLDALGQHMPDVQSRLPVHQLIQSSSVLAVFKRLGYEINFIGSIYSATQHHDFADHCHCDYPLFGEFESILIHTTPFRDTGLAGIDYRSHRNKIQRTFAALESLQPTSGPRLTLAHILAPHPPFIFEADGREVYPPRAFSFFDGSLYRGTTAEYKIGYRAQTRYVAMRLLRVIDRIEQISRETGRQPVIIIHGDHGPRLRFHATDAAQTDPAESVPILLAIRWAPTDHAHASVMSLVNIYRSFFRRYFKTDLPLLPDRAFVSSFLEPYRFLEVQMPPVGQ